MNAIRWSDNDRYLGPFTWAISKNYRSWAIVLKSGRDEDEDRDQSSCCLRISLGGASLLIALPEIIKPWKEKVSAKYWSEADIERMGRDWYWQITPVEYGFSYSDGF